MSRRSRTPRSEGTGLWSPGRHAAAFGTLAVLAALVWSAPAPRSSGPVEPVAVSKAVSVAEPVAGRVALAPSQGSPGIPDPVIPQPPPAPAADPVTSPDPVSSPEPVASPEPVPAPQPVPAPGPLQAPVVQPQVVQPQIVQPRPVDPGAQALYPPELSGPDLGPWNQPLAPASDPSGCPRNAAPGEVLPPSIWSVCPGLQPPGWAYAPMQPYISGPGPSPFAPAAPGVPGAIQIQIPQVTGFRTESAQQTLVMSGLNVGSVTEVPSSAPQGTVLRTDPPFGSAVEFGRAVDLVVAGR